MRSESKVKIQIWFISLFLLSCGLLPIESPNLNEIPVIDFPIEKLNQMIDLSAPTGWNNIEKDGTALLMVNNISNEEIIFKKDFGIKIFYSDENRWFSLENEVVYPDSFSDIVLKPNKDLDPLEIGSAYMMVGLDEIPKPTVLRVFVFGYVYKDSEKTDEKIGSYTDIPISN
jgi:hypothetical protein